MVVGASRPPLIPAILGVTAAAVYMLVAFAAVLSRGEYYDTIAYGLPAANLVTRGVLAMPQLGPQYNFDHSWLLNAPLLALGPVPFFAAFGVGRMPYLAGLLLFAAINLLVIGLALKRVLRLRHLGLGLFLALAFLLNRGLPMSDLYNQRYTAIVFSLVVVAFSVTETASSGLQGFAAGSLLLAHPATMPLAGIWCGSVVMRLRDKLPGERRRALRALAAFSVPALLAIAWFARPEPLREQFLAHLRFGNFRAFDAFMGLNGAVAAGPSLGLPSRVFNIVIVGAALYVLFSAARRTGAHLRALVPSALCVVLLLPLDALHGYLYYGYALMGLGPGLAGAFAGGRARTAALLLLTAMGLANVAVASRLDTAPAVLTTTTDSVRFAREHLREGDRAVLGPPFVYAAVADGHGIDVLRVVPQPYFLAGMDVDAFAADIDTRCNVYLGAPEWYFRPSWTDPPRGTPLLTGASIRDLTFAGQRVIVARRPAVVLTH